MALFSDLFTESTVAEVNENVTPDYLKDLPLAKFDENMSLLDCGAKGLVLAEAGWLDICESIRNMDALDEGLADITDNAKDKARKAGYKIKAGGTKVVAFLKKILGLLKKIAQNIFGTINKFLTTIAAAIKGNTNITDAEAAKKGLANYEKVNGTLYVKGFMFAEGADKAQTAYKKAMDSVSGTLKKWSQAARDKNQIEKTDKYTVEEKQRVLTDVRNTLCGGAPSNGDVTSKSFIVDMKNHYGKKYSKGDQHAVDGQLLNEAVKAVKGGYKDEQKIARDAYKTSRETINGFIKECDKMAEDFNNRINKDNDDKDNEAFAASARKAELAGNTMTACGGIMSSYMGAFCQRLHQQYSTYKSSLTNCVGYSKGGKVDDKVYGNKNESTSLFGLDLI